MMRALACSSSMMRTGTPASSESTSCAIPRQIARSVPVAAGQSQPANLGVRARAQRLSGVISRVSGAAAMEPEREPRCDPLTTRRSEGDPHRDSLPVRKAVRRNRRATCRSRPRSAWALRSLQGWRHSTIEPFQSSASQVGERGGHPCALPTMRTSCHWDPGAERRRLRENPGGFGAGDARLATPLGEDRQSAGQCTRTEANGSSPSIRNHAAGTAEAFGMRLAVLGAVSRLEHLKMSENQSKCVAQEENGYDGWNRHGHQVERGRRRGRCPAISSSGR